MVHVQIPLLASAASLFKLYSIVPPPICKAVPGSTSWPQTQLWDMLNASISGQLIKTIPPGSVCHPKQPTYNVEACFAVEAGWSTTDFHYRDPVSSEWNNFNNDSCLPIPNYPCSGAGYPIYVVNATTKEDVKKGVDFARKHNVRLLVKGTGHDYQGRSSGPNSLSIWTHHLRGLNFHLDNFTPKGCNKAIHGAAITVGAGEVFGDINSQAALWSLTVLSGGEASVGLGGYMTGGGHGALGPMYGMGADQVLEIEMVTPGGAIITANECTNHDLFWAMRGGGGSTFGVITSTTIAAYPSTRLATYDVVLATSALNPHFWPAVAYILTQLPNLTRQNIAGYTFFVPDLKKLGIFAGRFVLPVTSETNSSASLAAAFKPIIWDLKRKWPFQFVLALERKQDWPDFYSWWEQSNGPKEAGVDQIVGSWLVDEKSLANVTAVEEAFKGFTPPGGGAAFLVAGGKVSRGVARGGGNALLPAWRKALLHCTFSLSWDPLDMRAKNEQLTAATDVYTESLRKLAPHMGAYVNEALFNEPDFQHHFWGENYDKLLSIKRRYDPDDVFWCHPCVGNENWDEVDGVLCKK